MVSRLGGHLILVLVLLEEVATHIVKEDGFRWKELFVSLDRWKLTS